MKTKFLLQKKKALLIALAILLVMSFLPNKLYSQFGEVTVSNIKSSTCNVSWPAVSGATKYVVNVAYETFAYGNQYWHEFKKYTNFEVSGSILSLSLSEIGYLHVPNNDRDYTLDRMISVQAYKNNEKLSLSFKIFSVLWECTPPTISNFTTTTFNFNFSYPYNNAYYKARVNVQESNGNVWLNLPGYPKELSDNAPVHTVTGLTAGTQYRVMQQYYYKKYDLPDYMYMSPQWSDWSEAIIVVTIPNAPVAIAASNVKPNSFLANWKKTENADNYKLFVKEKSSGKAIFTGETNSLLLGVPNLDPGTQYEYQVTARNINGESVKSNAILVTTTTFPVPVAFDADQITGESFRARWSSVPNASGYKLEFNDGNVIKYYETAGVIYTLTDLKPNTTYKYKVRALFNSNTEYSGLSNEITTKTILAPTGLHTTAISEQWVNLTWNPTPGATGYKLWILSDEIGGTNPAGYNGKLIGNVTSYPAEGLQPGQNYKCYVIALTATGETLPSLTWNFNTKSTGPESLNLTNITGSGFTISWQKVQYATGYVLYITNFQYSTPVSGYYEKKLDSNTSTIDVTNLDVTAGYSVTVRTLKNTIESSKNSQIVALALKLTTNPSSGGGSASGGGRFIKDSNVTIKATPDNGYQFVNWTDKNSGEIVSTLATYTFTLAESQQLRANFRTATPEYTIALSANPAAGGKVTGAGTYTMGTSVTAKATPNAGYEFVNWTEGATIVSTTVQYNFTITSARTLVANFKQVATGLTLTLNESPAAGGDATGGGVYASGTSVTAKATPNAGYEFVNWTEGITVISTLATYNFTLNANRTLVANFRTATPESPTSLIVNPSVGGKVTGAGSYTKGTSVTAKATPNAGYEFVNWTEGTTVVSTSATYTFTLNANRTLVANFKQVATGLTLTLNENPAAGGDASGGGVYASGTSVTAKATPNADYEFVNWTEGTTVISTTATYTFTLNSNRTLVANFRKLTQTNYTLSLNSVPFTAGSTTGSGSYASGTNVTVTALPNRGYDFVNWTKAGYVVSTSATYKFDLIENTILVANFSVRTAASTFEKSDISVYPNPVLDILHISGLTGNETIRIRDLSGRVIDAANGISSEITSVSMGKFQPGIYLVEVVTDKSTRSVKVIKQ